MGSVFFRNRNNSGIAEVQMHSKNLSAGTYCFGNLISGKRQKSKKLLKLLEVATHFSPKIHGSNLLSRALSKYFLLYKGILWISFLIFPLDQDLDRPVMRKKCHWFGKSSNFNYFISQLHLPDFIHQANLYKSILSKTYYFCCVARVFDSPNIRKDAHNNDFSRSSNSKFSVMAVWPYRSRSQSQLFICRGENVSKNYVETGFRNLKVRRRLQKVLTLLKLHNNQTLFLQNP